jgi:hypothetical protein
MESSTSAGNLSIPANALLRHIPGSASYYQLSPAADFPFTADGANFASTTILIASSALALTLE